MKYKFEFDDSEENFDYKQLQRYLRIDDVIKVLIEIDEKLRSYENDSKRDSVPIEEVVETFRGIFQDNNIVLDEIDFE